MITKNFEDFILQCFSGELRTAELRLSDEERSMCRANTERRDSKSLTAKTTATAEYGMR